MRQSLFFSFTKKEDPKDEVAKNALLLIRAGFVFKEMAGVYSYLPLGLRVRNKIVAIVREEMNRVGGQEILLSHLQDSMPWTASGRWSDDVVDVWFKTVFKSGGEAGLAPTHEEPLSRIMSKTISSYRDLPLHLYQFQTKFRNEIRSKSGLLRGREFLMKDLYTFARTDRELDEFYETMKKAYFNIFRRVGISDLTFLTLASGGSFSPLSHEFQTLCSSGEDIIYLSREKNLAVNREVYTPEVLAAAGLSVDEFTEEKAIEVGNIFKLGTKFSEPANLYFLDEKGERRLVLMASYGVGIDRLLGTIAEVKSDQSGLVWPEAVAPFLVHIVSLAGGKDPTAVAARAETVYQTLQKEGLEVLFDDRDRTPGEKLTESDLLGIPWRVVISDRTEKAGQVEIRQRENGETNFILPEDILTIVGQKKKS